eukprot:GHRR01029995.1.p2 GENE.GHRR01029995.1~~GHRR01029995.1.p2  ORF type:complete len:104 (-),score=21.79 GHRR01029995.1:355-666(-)
MLKCSCYQPCCLSLQDICVRLETNKHLLSELTNIGRAAKLKGFEMVKAIYVDSNQFSVDNDLMTPTFKLKRAQLQKHYKPEIDAMYQAVHDAVAANSRLFKTH